MVVEIPLKVAKLVLHVAAPMGQISLQPPGGVFTKRNGTQFITTMLRSVLSVLLLLLLLLLLLFLLLLREQTEIRLSVYLVVFEYSVIVNSIACIYISFLFF